MRSAFANSLLLFLVVVVVLHARTQLVSLATRTSENSRIDQFNRVFDDRIFISPTEKVELLLESVESITSFSIPNLESLDVRYFMITNQGSEAVSTFVSINDAAWGSLIDFISDSILLRQNDVLTPEEKVLRVFHYYISHVEHWYPPNFDETQRALELYTPLRMLNVWGYGFCSDHSKVLSAIYAKIGLQTRVVYLEDHVVLEVFYDEAWHMFDPDRLAYYRNSDGAVASVAELNEDVSLIKDMSWYTVREKWMTPRNQEVFAKEKSDYEFTYSSEELSIFESDQFMYSLHPKEELYFFSQQTPSVTFLTYEPTDEYFQQQSEPYNLNLGIGLIDVVDLPYASNSTNERYFFKSGYPTFSLFLDSQQECQEAISIKLSFDEEWQEVFSTSCKDGVYDFSEFFSATKHPVPPDFFQVLVPDTLQDGTLIRTFPYNAHTFPTFFEQNNKVELSQFSSQPLKVEMGLIKGI